MVILSEVPHALAPDAVEGPAIPFAHLKFSTFPLQVPLQQVMANCLYNMPFAAVS